jgi:hypothetical protein
MFLILVKDVSEDPPHVVLKIRIKEIHAPSFLLWRKASQHQQFGVGGEERLERVFFDDGYDFFHERTLLELF